MSVTSAIETVINGITTFFESLGHIWDLVKYFFTDYIPDIIVFALDIILMIPEYVFAVFLNLIIVVFNVIPVPDFIARAGPALSNIGSTVLFFSVSISNRVRGHGNTFRLHSSLFHSSNSFHWVTYAN